MIGPIYSDPRITIKSKGLLENPPNILEYKDAVEETVAEVVDAIKQRIEKEDASKISKERR